MNILLKAQGSSEGVICGGCGRVLEPEFMELDHITPKSDEAQIISSIVSFYAVLVTGARGTT